MPEDDRPWILVVEDDTLIRMLGVDILEEAGFSVLEAENADEAIALLHRHDDVRVLFSDIDMPGSMDGVELARLVHDRWPAIRLLLTSGHHRLPDAAVPANGAFVPKPWTPTRSLPKFGPSFPSPLPPTLLTFAGSDGCPKTGLH